jgi:hypothetical protein
MTVVQRYTQSVLAPQLRSLGLNERQREIVVADVTMRLESLLSHWPDLPFRRTALVLGTEEATFWEPRSAGLEIRSLVVVAVRNSLVTDRNASLAYTKALRSGREWLPDERMPWVTGEAVNYFQAANLDALPLSPRRDLFGSLPRRFPNAWHVLSLLGGSAVHPGPHPAPRQDGADAELPPVAYVPRPPGPVAPSGTLHLRDPGAGRQPGRAERTTPGRAGFAGVVADGSEPGPAL